MNHSKPFLGLSLIAATMALMLGCAGGSKNPVQPITTKPAHTDRQSASSPRQLMGLWTVAIDESRLSAEIAPVRLPQMHLNVVRLLEVFPCKNCLTIGNIKMVEPNILEADLTLTHPYPGLLKYTGFDVRGIFISEANYTFPASGRQIARGTELPVVLNPDGFTSLFNPTEYPPTSPPILGYIPGKHATGGDLTATLNPYLAYRRDAPRRMFESGGSEIRTVRLYAPTGPIHFGYAVDASWQLVENVIDPLTDFPPDANCLEAYAISVDIATGLGNFPGSSAPIGVEVYDHQGQDTISSVTIEAPDLFTGEMSLTFSTAMPDGGFLFTGTLSNDFGMEKGEYPLLVKAADTQTDQNLGEVAAWQVSSVSVHKGWARTWGGKGEEDGQDVAIDASGNGYVTGFFSYTVDFDPGPGVDYHTSEYDSYDIFLSKFDPDGNFVWAQTWGGVDWDMGLSVAIDGSGSAFVTGYFGETVDFDPGPDVDNHTANLIGWDTFLSKFDSNGNFVWARTWGGSHADKGWSVAIDGSGNAYITGLFEDTEDFDPGAGVDEHSSNGDQDAFLSKFDPNGNFIWARTWGGSDWDEGLSVAIDSSENAYATGYFRDTVDFDPGTGMDNHTSNGSDDVFLSKFDQNGNLVWTRTWGGPGGDEGWSVAIDGSGNAYITGHFQDTVDFDPGGGLDNLTSNGDKDVFLSKLDPNGDFVWARAWGASEWDRGCSVALDGFWNVYITGHFEGTVDFDPGAGVDSHASNGHRDAYLSKFDSNGNLLWACTWGGPYQDWGMSVEINGSGNAYVGGVFDSTVDFDPGAGVDNHTSNGMCDAFLSKFPPDGNW